jgi:hypothetical protein
VLQRRINYSSPSKSFGVDGIRNREELIAAIRSKFRLLSLSAVTALVDEIEVQDEVWTLNDVYRVCAQRNKEAPVPLSTSEQTGDIRLPSRDAHRNDFGFTTRTRLGGKIKRKKKKKQVPLPESTQSSDTWHAEDDLMRHLDSLLERGEVDPENDEIVITINNSPCLARCAANLAAWKRKHWRGRIVIYFANPHGSEEDYIAARQMLRLAGIEVRSFEPLLFISANSLDVKQKKRFLAMKDRRKRYRKLWNEEHPSDFSSDTEGEAESREKARASKAKRKRSTSGSKASASASTPVPTASASTSTAPRRSFRAGHVTGLPGTRADVLGTGMNCLIRALLRALGVPGAETWVQPIRTHINQNAGALPGTMLELAGVAGAVLISFLVQQGALLADRGIDVYMPDEVHGGYQRVTVVAGHNPVRLYLEDEHFEAIV